MLIQQEASLISIFISKLLSKEYLDVLGRMLNNPFRESRFIHLNLGIDLWKNRENQSLYYD